jgi:hypothetical protein
MVLRSTIGFGAVMLGRPLMNESRRRVRPCSGCLGSVTTSAVLPLSSPYSGVYSVHSEQLANCMLLASKHSLLLSISYQLMIQGVMLGGGRPLKSRSGQGARTTIRPKSVRGAVCTWVSYWRYSGQ